MTWKIKEKEWKEIASAKDLRLSVMRAMKMTQLVTEEESQTVKAVLEICTIMMRMEQNVKNNNKDEIRAEKAIKKIRGMLKQTRRNTNYMAIHLNRNQWAIGILKDLKKICTRHGKRIFLESKRIAIVKMVEEWGRATKTTKYKRTKTQKWKPKKQQTLDHWYDNTGSSTETKPETAVNPLKGTSTIHN